MGCVSSKRFHGHLHFSSKSSDNSSNDRPQTSAANTDGAVRKIVEEEEDDDDELKGEEIEKAICQSVDPKSSAMAKLLALLSESHVQTEVDINSKENTLSSTKLFSTTWNNNNVEDQEEDRIVLADENDDDDNDDEYDEEEPTRKVDPKNTSSDQQKSIIASSPSHHNSNIKEERDCPEISLHKKKAKARRSKRRQKQQQPSFEFKTVGSLKEWLGSPGSFYTPKFGGNNSTNLEIKDVQN
ncbi:hypothetical protein ZOSMA_291G00070 [Zostera marina]|uniref:Uncharacterized protein n=1 Tax=Zostera marina TaxID=29655 RepID=A0A0K9PEI2_ZOSMR|nr:hypothetical protein ZOSMA_291G00070 [Zostera marina]